MDVIAHRYHLISFEAGYSTVCNLY
jgi:hypothetical protein